MHLEDPDPWDCQTSWYEERKRGITLSLLPRRRYRHILEIGCSVGHTTVELARRGEQVTAVDASSAALRHARQRTEAALKVGRAGTVQLLELAVPGQWPPPPAAPGYDLVVISEVGYYLNRAELEALERRLLASASPEAELVLCHWRHPIRGWAGSAAMTHGFFQDSEHWRAVCGLEEPDTRYDVFIRCLRAGPGERR